MLKYGSAYEPTLWQDQASIDPPRLVFNKPWCQWGQCSILAASSGDIATRDKLVPRVNHTAIQGPDTVFDIDTHVYDCMVLGYMCECLTNGLLGQSYIGSYNRIGESHVHGCSVLHCKYWDLNVLTKCELRPDREMRSVVCED
jgi:hypothetical protein